MKGIICSLAAGMLINTSVVMAASPTHSDIPKISWSDIQTGDLIGAGSFGEVYKGQWQGKNVAVKKLHMKSLPEKVRQDFEKEAAVVWRCQYPNIIRLHGVCTDTGNAAMIFEHMQNGSLNDRLQKEPPLSEMEQWQIAIDIAQGLAQLHHSSVLHRDLKSHNILLDHRLRAKISDFGLAKLRLATATSTGRTGGTLRWSAPELLDDEPAPHSPKTDMYSYGMILWELVSRKIPFHRFQSEMIAMGKIIGGAKETVPEECPPLWRNIIEACWGTPDQRPTAQWVLDQLRQAHPNPPKPTWLPEEIPDALAVGAKGYHTYLATHDDWQKVLISYVQHPVPGYDVGRIEVIYSPTMNEGFRAKLKSLQQRHGNSKFSQDWQHGSHADWRRHVHGILETLAAPHEQEDYQDVKVLPVWHGTQKAHLQSILSTGYLPFCHTDDGYFGKGLYAANEAAYAEMYASGLGPHSPDGILIFNWVALFNGYPIVSKDYNVTAHRLTTEIDTAKYDAHFIPVLDNPAKPNQGDFMPTDAQHYPNHTYIEVMVREQAQMLPRYLVTLQPSLTAPVPLISDGQMGAMLKAFQDNVRYRDKLHALKLKDAAGKGAANDELLAKQRQEFEKHLQTQQQRYDAQLQAQREKSDQERRADKQRYDAQLAQQQESEARLQAQYKKYEQAYTAEKKRADGADRAKTTLQQQLQEKELARKEMEDLLNSVLSEEQAAEQIIYPPVARGYEAEYKRFLTGRLIYRKGRPEEQTLAIRDLSDPLDCAFDLSHCGNTGNYLQIATGYRKSQNPANKNKFEVWIAPRILIERELQTTAGQYRDIMSKWPQTNEVGIFFNWGNWDDLRWYDYLVHESTQELSNGENLYKKYCAWHSRDTREWAIAHTSGFRTVVRAIEQAQHISNYIFKLNEI